MKIKFTLILLIVSFSAFSQNRMYNLTTQFDSVKVRKLIMTTIAEGGNTDSVLVKKANGGVFKVARSSFSGGGSGTVTSVGLSVPTGLSITGSPITTSGVMAIGLQSGYSIPLLSDQSYWSGKQDVLVSGTSIKTVGGISILGNGDIPLPFGTVTSFGKTDGYGISSSVSNPTTTPVHTIAVDTTLIRTVNNSLSLSQIQTKLNGYVPSSRNLTSGTGVNTIGDLSADRTISIDTTTIRTTANSLSLSQAQTKLDTKITMPSGVVQGDLLYATGTNAIDRLPKNITATRYLSNTGTNNAPAWAQINVANGITGIVAGVNGGTGQNFYAVGDILYASTSTNLTKRNIGTTGQILKVTGGLPVWSDADYFQNFLASGNGSATSITITHGLTGITGTSKVIVQPLNAASAGVLYAAISSTTVTIVYNVAPANGTNNLSYSILVRP